MSKQVIRLTENDLRNIIKESVSKILKEGFVSNNSNLEILQTLKGEVNSFEWVKSAKRIMFNLGRKVANNNYDIDEAFAVKDEIVKISRSQNYQDFGQLDRELRRAFDLGEMNSRIHDGLYESTGDFGYTDDNAPSNRPAIGTSEYYRRNDRMQIGQEPLYNNARNWDDPDYNRKKSIGDSKPFNTNRGW